MCEEVPQMPAQATVVNDDATRKNLWKSTRSKSLDEKHKEYTCSHCKRIFKNKISFTIHLRFECNQNISSAMSSPTVKDEVPRERFRCTQCGRSYKYEKSLPLHLRFECRQTDCPSSVRIPNNDFRLNIDLEGPSTRVEEQKTKVEEAKAIVEAKSNLTCYHCGHVFSNEKSLKYHLRFDCEGKNISSMSASDVVNVVASKDAKERFECSKCAKSYKYEKSLLLHLKYGCGEKDSFPSDQSNDEHDKM